MARGGDGAGTTEIHEGRPEIDNEETEHPEHDRCIGKAHQPSGRAPAAFNRIGNVGIEAVILTSIRPAPQIRVPKRARRTRGGTKSSYRDAANIISEEYEKNRAHLR